MGADGDLCQDAEPFQEGLPLLRCVGGQQLGQGLVPVGLLPSVVFVLSRLLSVIVRSRSGESAGRRPLLTGRWMGAARRGRKGRAPGGVYAGSGPAAAPARAGRAGQSLKKVIWNPSPKRMCSPPGILLANRTREW